MASIKKVPISVFIIALNEGDRILRSIESVKRFADEVIVIDSGSADNTISVSLTAGAKVIHNKWPGYGLQKRFGEDHCRNDWLLNIDADEVVNAELAEEICALFEVEPSSPLPYKMKTLPEHGGYWVKIVEILPGRKRPGWFAHKVTAIRLYNKKLGRFSDSTVHDSVLMQSGVSTGALKGIMEHRSSRGLAHSMDKVNRYSTMQADNLRRKDKRVLFPRLRLIIEFPAGFIKAYIFRAYIFKGRQGFVNAMVYGWSRFIRLAKYLELKDKN